MRLLLIEWLDDGQTKIGVDPHYELPEVPWETRFLTIRHEMSAGRMNMIALDEVKMLTVYDEEE